MFKQPSRATWIIGIATYLLLLGLAMLFYLERIVFSDMAFHTVTILKNKTLFIQNQRFVAAFTQFFPITASGLHLSLKGVMMAYSASFVALYLLVFSLCVFWLKSWKMGLLMLCCSIIVPTETFYWIQSELPQGMAVLVLTLALLEYISHRTVSSNAVHIGALFLLWITVAYAHPMLAFPTFFALLFFRETASSQQRGWYTASGVFVLGVLLIKNKLIGTAAYDAEAMSRVKNLVELFPNYFNLASNRQFLTWCVTDYWLLSICFLAINAVYGLQRNWRKLLLFNAFFFGYLLLVNVSIPKGYHQYYMENLYLPLGFFVALPLIFDVLPHWGNGTSYPAWAFPALALCIGLRVVGIGLAHQPWTNRVAWQNQFLRDNPGKLLLSENQVPMDVLLQSWGTSFEFLLLSSLENPAASRMVCIDEDPSRLAWATAQPRSVITEWEVWPYEKLPPRYFLPQDTSAYVIRAGK
jgi:hypothetical protein